MEENVKISMLNEIYGKMLTKKQYEIIDDYYNNDLSLSEIAQNNEITRQAVRDILKKGEKKLFEYEENLLLMEKTLKQGKKIEKVLGQLETIQKSNSNQKIVSEIQSIISEVQSLGKDLH
ncbi:MAG: putative DNA-binding protein [Clostridia bacterium]|nr:putative DNA-binding protein [Clostridia bacterium]